MKRGWVWNGRQMEEEWKVEVWKMSCRVKSHNRTPSSHVCRSQQIIYGDGNDVAGLSQSWNEDQAIKLGRFGKER